MEIRNLRSFIKIAESGSFTKAAEALGYAQPTLTFQMQSIEAHYGQPVFERVGKSARLTSFGTQLLAQAETLLREYERVERFGMEDETPRGSLRIGAPESLILYRLYPIIKAFKSSFPQVELNVVSDPCEWLIGHLHSGQLDLSFLLQPELDDPKLEITRLHEERMCLIAPAGHRRPDFLPEETQMILYTEKACTYRQEFDRYLARHQFSPTNILETANVEAIKRYVISGLGVSCLPYYSVIHEARNGLLRMKSLEDGQRFFTQIAYHKKKWVSPAMRAFLDCCHEYSTQWDVDEASVEANALSF